MKGKINKYLPGNIILRQEADLGALVLGDCNSAIDLAVLKPSKVKTMVSIGQQAAPPMTKKLEDIKYHCYDIHDNKQQKIPVELFDEVCMIIQQARKVGGVLVHCYAGVSRSSSFVIAYVMSKYKMGYEAAKQKVKKHRACIHPGDGFVRQLQHYAKVLENREAERLASLKQQYQQEEHLKFQPPNQSSVSQRIRKGVRGAVRSAEMIPENIKLQIGQPKIQEKQQKVQDTKSEFKDIKMHQKQEKVEKLPPINQAKVVTNRYEHGSSRLQIKRSIEKIEGRSVMSNVKSTRGIYSNKTKVL